ncbi:MAG: 2'-5' RNA ligase family protein [Candidatus Parcubacteria bacterium]|nr:2'-5' RNA ligase family protein [Leptolyngbyaceae cyanobacterium LF-bin-113]
MSHAQRFFIALLPPQAIRDYVDDIKHHFAVHYGSYQAQKSPPHITLQPPFEWASDQPHLEQGWREFAQVAPVPVTLEGFSAFPPRVIYIDVVKTPELLTLQKQLMDYSEARFGIVDRASKNRPFAPHMTVAFRDLTEQNFSAAWQEFRDRSLHFEFMANELTLLVHNGQRWTIAAEFPLIKPF